MLGGGGCVQVVHVERLVSTGWRRWFAKGAPDDTATLPQTRRPAAAATVVALVDVAQRSVVGH